MYKSIFIILFSLIFVQELEVDGVIKANSGIDTNNNPITNVGAPLTMSDAINGNVLQDALRDDAVYEYLLYQVKIGTNNSVLNAEWILLDIGTESWSTNFTSELNARALEGYEIHSMMNLPWNTYESYTNTNDDFAWAAPYTNNLSFTLFILKKPIEE